MAAKKGKDTSALGPFLKEVESRLEALPHDTLKALLTEYARDLPKGRRPEFLAMLPIRPASASTSLDAGPKTEEDEGLLEDIDAFVSRLSAGEYVDGWGWDHEIHDERSWGDESWVHEMADLFDMAAETFLAGNYRVAAEAYGRLLNAFHLEEESGAFCGQLPPEEMVTTDVDEAKARYFRSVYEIAPIEERATRLFLAMQGLAYIGDDDVGIQAVVDADTKPLPDLAAFLPEWLGVLQEEREGAGYLSDRKRQWLLREATRLSGGADALGELAREHGRTHPECFYEWVGLLVTNGDHQGAIAAAQEGVGQIVDGTARAMLADTLALLAHAGGDAALALDARRQAWRSSPSLRRLLLLCEQGDPEAEEQVERLRAERRHFAAKSRELNTRLSCALELLCGEYDTAAERLGEAKAVGWSGADHPGSVVFPFMLAAGSALEGLPAGSVLADFWERMEGAAPRYDFPPEGVLADYAGWEDEAASPAPRESYPAMLRAGLARCPATEEQRDRFLKLARSVARKRARHIVSNQLRQAYGRAAEAAVACAEAFYLAGRNKAGNDIIKGLREEFPRHSAFRRELQDLVSDSPLLPGGLLE